MTDTASLLLDYYYCMTDTALLLLDYYYCMTDTASLPGRHTPNNELCGDLDS